MTNSTEEVTLKEVEQEQVPKICLSKKCDALSRYYREAVLRINLERQNKKLKEQNVIYKEAVDSLFSAINELINPSNPAINFLRERLQDISKVTEAYYFVTDQVINLWIMIKEEDFEVEMKIADALVELMRVFKNLRFDFMIIPKYDIRSDEILPKDSLVIFEEKGV